MGNPHLGAIFDWRTWVVFARNARVYFKNWRTAFLPPALEPLIFFLAFGLGLGSYVGLMTFQGQEITYPTYVAPGLLAYATFTTPFFEGLYGSYVRMFYQKTWDGILATQVEMEHIVWGEITWCGVRGMMNATVVTVVLAILTFAGLIDLHWYWLPLAPVLGGLAGWAFGAFAMIFTAIVPSIDHMNYPVFLIGVPLGLVSNTYFPIDGIHPALDVAVQLNPVYHLAEALRSMLVGGRPDMHIVWLLVSAGVLMVACAAFAQPLSRKRVLGE